MMKIISKEAETQASIFETTEKVFTGRALIKIIKLLNEEKYISARNLYAYIRYLDDIVDDGKNILETMEILKKEKAFLESLHSSEITESVFSSPQQELVIQALNENKNKDKIIEHLLLGLKAFYLDAIAIKYKRPLPEFVQSQRDTLSLLPYLETLSLILFDTGFSKINSQGVFAEIISAWAKYDALRDFDEDFTAGLVIFSRSELKEFALNLQEGQEVGSQFNELHSKLKPRTIKKILENIRSINQADIPIIVQLVFQAYFLTTIVKLILTKSMGDKKIVFAETKTNL